MAFVLRNAVVKLDSTDVSALVRDVAVDMKADDIDTTSMGAVGHQRLAGLRDDTISLTAYSSFAAAGLHSVVYAKFAAAGTLAVSIWPNENGGGSTTGTANPNITASCPLLTYSPLSGAVGAAAMTPLNLPVSGTISIATV
jgi:hypothetical protein